MRFQHKVFKKLRVDTSCENLIRLKAKTLKTLVKQDIGSLEEPYFWLRSD